MSANGTTTATPAESRREVVPGLPPWCASVRYTNGTIVLTARVPVPAMPHLEQLAWQREQADRDAYLRATSIPAMPPPPPATFELALALSEDQAESLEGALSQLLEAARKARSVVDVAPVIDVD